MRRFICWAGLVLFFSLFIGCIGDGTNSSPPSESGLSGKTKDPAIQYLLNALADYQNNFKSLPCSKESEGEREERLEDAMDEKAEFFKTMTDAEFNRVDSLQAFEGYIRNQEEDEVCRLENIPRDATIGRIFTGDRFWLGVGEKKETKLSLIFSVKTIEELETKYKRLLRVVDIVRKRSGWEFYETNVHQATWYMWDSELGTVDGVPKFDTITVTVNKREKNLEIQCELILSIALK